MNGVRQKSELKLGEHVRKALSPAETAPKQKHVRALIMFAWDYQTSEPVWGAVGMHPMTSDAIVCYKGLAALHKLLVGGPHVVLSEGLAHRAFLESCMRAHGHSTFGYGPLVGAYVPLLLAKLEFHRLHPAFTGNFDYEEYVSVRGVANLDEGYETVGNLLCVLDRIAGFQAALFGGGSPNECRAAPLVPLVEEAHGVYKFVTSMLAALVRDVESADVLLPLVERYRTHLRTLRALYAECRRIPHIAAVVDVPELPPAEPAFVPAVVASSPPRIVQRTPVPAIAAAEEPRALVVSQPAPLVDLLGDIPAEPRTHTDLLSDHRDEVTRHVHTVTTVPVHDERLAAEVYALRSQLAEAHAALAHAQEAYACAEHTLATYAERDERLASEAEELRCALRTAEVRLASAPDATHADAAVADARATAEASVAEAARWKSRFEGVAALYQGLRGEHLAALSRVRSLQDALRGASSNGSSTGTSSPSASSDRLGDEMAAVARAVDEAARRIAAMQVASDDSAEHRAVHAAVVGGASEIADAVAALVRAAIRAQRAVVAAGRASGMAAAEFYNQHSVWTDGLVSAARAVGASTAVLVDTADGALRGTHGAHHVAAASAGIASATAQLVAATRVKAADLSSADVPGLESAASAVTDASRRLSASSAAIMDPACERAGDVPADAFARRVEELERQARVLSLERELAVARGDLATLRRAAYEAVDEGRDIATRPDSLGTAAIGSGNNVPSESAPDSAKQSGGMGVLGSGEMCVLESGRVSAITTADAVGNEADISVDKAPESDEDKWGLLEDAFAACPLPPTNGGDKAVPDVDATNDAPLQCPNERSADG